MAWIITDIEGTTTSIDFVHSVLFPYSRTQMREFVQKYRDTPEIREILTRLWQEDLNRSASERIDLELIVAKLIGWIDEDKKHSLLKALQGKIWKAGYENGHYRSHVYSDVPPALKDWHERGINLAVYSSGSVEAQKLLFTYSEYGDLTPYFKKYFDTAIGSKRDSSSYRNIFARCEANADDCLFLSDISEELDAAHTAGMQTYQLLRPGTKPSPQHKGVQCFADIIA